MESKSISITGKNILWLHKGIQSQPDLNARWMITFNASVTPITIINGNKRTILHSGEIALTKGIALLLISEDPSLMLAIQTVVDDHIIEHYSAKASSVLYDPIKSQLEVEIVYNIYLRNLFLSFLPYFTTRSMVCEDVLYAKIFELLFMLEHVIKVNPISKDSRLQELQQIISENIYKKDISISKMAEQSNMSVSTFKRLFILLFKEPVWSWLTARRLEKARSLVQATPQSIKEIAVECGFSSSSYFIRAFKKSFGSTPMDFRKNNSFKIQFPIL